MIRAAVRGTVGASRHGREKTGLRGCSDCVLGAAGWADMLGVMAAALVYRDDLPRGCPPGGAEIRGTVVVYRWVEHDPVDPEEDFKS